MILLAYTYPKGGQTVTGEIALDAALTEQHTGSSEVTQHQVEVGTNVADNIRPIPRRLQIEGFVSNVPIQLPKTQNRGVRAQEQKFSQQTPLGNVVEYSALGFDGPLDRTRDVFNELDEARLAGALFTITTSLKTYQNFAITNLTVPRDPTTGDSLHFTIEFQELRFVEAQTVKGLPPKQKAISKPDHKGEKPTAEAPEKRRSLLKKLVGAISGAQ